jgi:hydrogenase nickel incorporation protein HypB
MCTVCGCGAGETRLEGDAHEHTHTHEDGTVHSHAHEHHHEHAVGADLDYSTGPARAHVPGLSQLRMVQIEQDILAKNNTYAAANRAWFDEHGIFALNLVSSPGSGKTALLVKTIALLKDKVAIHLDGHMVGHAREKLKPADESLFLIENVGNLVCPAAFDLGEQHKIAILSVTEGEDKPLKYPDMFAAADVLLLNKCDLLPYLEFDADLAEANARRVNPQLTIFRVSASTGEGLPGWVSWIESGLEMQRGKRVETVAALKARITELEQLLAGH